jgi:serine/threonine-protein kinase
MSSSASPPGAQIGKYQILAHIATGGMGTVYQARDEVLGRVVALKVLDPDLASNPVLLERFRREARAASRLVHKNIVTLYECGEANGLYYIAMEYIEGIDLSEYIRRKGQIDPEEARRLIIQAAKALEHAARQGITHRDIKPSNFLLANDEGRCRVKLIDLGLSCIHNENDFKITRDNTTVGTVDYMAPEQARDSSLSDIRSDIYSLGCTLYHMLAGQPPFAEGGLGERIYKHIASDPPDVRLFNPQVPAGLWTVLRRMLAKHPDDRFQTPTELIQALRSVADPQAQVRPVDFQAPGPAGEALVVRPPSSSPEATIPSIPSSSAVQPAARERSAGRQPQPSPSEAPVKRKRPSTAAELTTVPDDTPDVLGITPEQRQAAAGQFHHATEVIRTGGDPAYAQQLLLSCCKLDPVHLHYRRKLRDVSRDLARTRKAGWLGSLGSLPGRNRLRSARNAGDHRKVLEYGEELLCRNSGDVAAHLAMAASAEALYLPSLAIWLLEEASEKLPRDVSVLRTLAALYERQKRLPQAIATWEKVHALAPNDREAPGKIKDLSASDTIARGNFKV